MQTIFKGNGPVFEAANHAFCVLFEGAGVSKTFSRARHMLIDKGYTPEDAAEIVHRIKNAVYDPLATPGVNPETDPKVKKYMDWFLKITEYVADNIMPRFYDDIKDTRAQQRIAHLGEGLRDIWREYKDQPFYTWMLSKADGNLNYKVNTQPVPGYTLIPVKTCEELRQKLTELGADDVQWCIKSNGPWENYSSHGTNQFYILFNPNKPKTDNMSIIGTFVTPQMRVANSFNRDNNPVSFITTTEYLRSAGLEMADYNNLESALSDDMYDLAELVDDCTEITSNVFLVYSESNGGYNVVVYNDGHYSVIMPDWVPDNTCRVIHDGDKAYYATDGTNVYSLRAPYEKCGSVPAGLTITDDFVVDDALIVAVTRGNKMVNVYDLDENELLLDPDSDVPITDVRFWSTWLPKEQRHLEFANTKFNKQSYWILSYESHYDKPIAGPEKFYVVTQQGQNLADCPCVEVPRGFRLREISRNGKFYSLEREVHTREEVERNNPRTYLMSDDKKVLPDPYRNIDDNGDGIWYIYNDAGKGKPYFVLNTDTGDIEEKCD
jgi:hypothetical protein